MFMGKPSGKCLYYGTLPFSSVDDLQGCRIRHLDKTMPFIKGGIAAFLRHDFKVEILFIFFLYSIYLY